jgi:hypothetical protein
MKFNRVPPRLILRNDLAVCLRINRSTCQIKSLQTEWV